MTPIPLSSGAVFLTAVLSLHGCPFLWIIVLSGITRLRHRSIALVMYDMGSFSRYAIGNTLFLSLNSVLGWRQRNLLLAVHYRRGRSRRGDVYVLCLDNPFRKT